MQLLFSLNPKLKHGPALHFNALCIRIRIQDPGSRILYKDGPALCIIRVIRVGLYCPHPASYFELLDINRSEWERHYWLSGSLCSPLHCHVFFWGSSNHAQRDHSTSYECRAASRLVTQRNTAPHITSHHIIHSTPEQRMPRHSTLLAVGIHGSGGSRCKFWEYRGDMHGGLDRVIKTQSAGCAGLRHSLCEALFWVTLKGCS
jgi:hypothetical protein